MFRANRIDGSRILRWPVACAGALTLFGLAPTSAAQGVTTRVSVDSAGAEANGESLLSFGVSVQSQDGRYVTFYSDADNLVGNDTNADYDVFVHDRYTRETVRVSVDSGGLEGNAGSTYPSISPDGRFVAFDSNASNLVPGDTNGQRDVFVHDRQTGVTTRVNLDSSGNQATGGPSYQPSLSADHRYVAFDSLATSLVPGDTNGSYDVFVHDRQTGETVRVSTGSGGSQSDADSYFAGISADGRFVHFRSEATNLVPGDTNGAIDIFVHELQTGQTSRVSVDSNGNEGDGGCDTSSISADGRYVAFSSGANNLVPGDTNIHIDVFVHDRQTGETTRVSVDSAGNEADDACARPAISADGSIVAFLSYAWSADDSYWDVFIHDRLTAETKLVSVDSLGNETSKSTFWPGISPDGRYVAFMADGGDLVPGDTNADWDVFVHDLQDCTTSVAVYCTAKTTSSGCTPALTTAGAASATSPSGFTVSAQQVEPNQTGILFWGRSGPAALPFQGGLLCVMPPLRRTPVQTTGSGGPPPCTGVLTLDLNAEGICSAIGMGYLGWMQGWFRDPPSATSTGLTDAVGFVVCP